jgi:hypothetical protein
MVIHETGTRAETMQTVPAAMSPQEKHWLTRPMGHNLNAAEHA